MTNQESLKQFNLDINNWSAKVGVESRLLFIGIATRLFENVVRRTPVGDPDYWQGHPKGSPSGNSKPPTGYLGGTAKNSWFCSINDKVEGGQRSADKQGAAALDEINLRLVGAKLGDTAYLQNPLPYIQSLEDGTGSPRQAPEGMVQVSMAEIVSFYSNLNNVPVPGGAR